MIHAERPLGKHRLPGLERRGHNLKVFRHPNGYNHEVDVRMVHELLRRRHRVVEAEFLGGRLGGFDPAMTQGRKAVLRQRPERWHMHDFRNELYHVGLQHESILPYIARFYLSVACGVLERFKGRGLSYWHGTQLPERCQQPINVLCGYQPGSKPGHYNASKAAIIHMS